MKRILASGLIAGFMLAAAPVSAQNIAAFQHEADAKARCPGQGLVWLQPNGTYVFKGPKYGKGKGGYACQLEAERAGYKPGK
jgi:hypothetical protein